MRKSDELTNPYSCLNQSYPDEPIFVLRARDPLAATTVRAWAEAAKGSRLQRPVHEAEKIQAALMCADTMDNWRNSAANPKQDYDLWRQFGWCPECAHGNWDHEDGCTKVEEWKL